MVRLLFEEVHKTYVLSSYVHYYNMKNLPPCQLLLVCVYTVLCTALVTVHDNSLTKVVSQFNPITI